MGSLPVPPTLTARKRATYAGIATPISGARGWRRGSGGLGFDDRQASLGSGLSSAAIRPSGRVYPRDDAAGTTAPESRLSHHRSVRTAGVRNVDQRTPRRSSPP